MEFGCSLMRASATPRISLDLGDGTAAIIDPPRFAIEHVAAARTSGAWRLRWTIDTHSHADYVTGSPDLVTDHARDVRRGLLHRSSATPHLEPSHDEERIVLAPSVALRAIATPGPHTGSPCLRTRAGRRARGAVHRRFLDGRRNRTHRLVRAGSRRTVGSRHVPLVAPPRRRPPDHLAVYPNHGAGSFCSAPGGAEPHDNARGGTPRRNTLLRIDDAVTFVEQLLAGFGSFPSYFAPTAGTQQARSTPLSRGSLTSTSSTSAPSNGILAYNACSWSMPDRSQSSRLVTSRGRSPTCCGRCSRSWLGWITDLDRPVVIVARVWDTRPSRRSSANASTSATTASSASSTVASTRWRAAGGVIARIPLDDGPGCRPFSTSANTASSKLVASRAH